MALSNNKELAALFEKIINNDQEAFATFYRLTYKKLYSYAFYFLKNRELAEDTVQEAYILLLKNCHKIRNPQYMLAYLNKINHNCCIRQKSKYLRDMAELSDFSLDLFPDPNFKNTPVGTILDSETQMVLSEALFTLDERHRSIFILRYVNKTKLKDIADIMDCSLSTVKRSLKESRSLLKAFLKDMDYLPGFIFAGSVPALFKDLSIPAVSSDDTAASLFREAFSETYPANEALCDSLNFHKVFHVQALSAKAAGLLTAVITISSGVLITTGVFFSPILKDTPQETSSAAVTAPSPLATDDRDGPALVSNAIVDDTLVLEFSDTAGIDPQSIKAAFADGNTPITIAEDGTQVILKVPESPGELTISDFLGNTASYGFDQEWAMK